MLIFGFSSKTLGPNVRILALPLFAVLVFIFLFIFVIKFGIAQITGQYKGVKETSRIERILKDKASFLRQIRGTQLEDTGVSLTAHPHNNPSVWMISHLRQLEGNFSLTSKDIRISFNQEGSEELKKAQIDTEIEGGDIYAILDFLLSFPTLAPISRLNEVSLKQEAAKNIVSSEVKITIYWSALPTKIPPITEPVTALSDKELKTLELVSILRPPQFTSLSPEFPVDRPNPFN